MAVWLGVSRWPFATASNATAFVSSPRIAAATTLRPTFLSSSLSAAPRADTGTASAAAAAPAACSARRRVAPCALTSACCR